MQQMKDSKIPWIGEIPNHWKILPNKYIFNISKNIVDNPEKHQLLSLTTKGVKDKDENDLGGKVPDNYNGYQRVNKGDLILCLFDLDCSAVFSGLSNYKGMISPAYKIVNSKTGIGINNYFKYFFAHAFNGRHYKQYSKSLRFTVNADEFLRIKSIVPSLEEQIKISNYLDKKCVEIDGLITDIEKEIEILTQYKKSIITEAVTKGLDKDTKLKNSGIEWAKQIPEHWEVSRIANVYNLRNQKVCDSDFEPLSVTMKGIFPQWENVAKSDAHDDRKLVRKGDFAINSRSDRRGSCGISDRDGSVSLINLVLQPLINMNPNYYNWLFHTESFADEFYKWGHGIVNDLWTTNWQDMKRILIPQPPIKEQKEIAEYLDKKCKEIDSILENKNKQLNTLESYKKSIIYEYVTGKKEVI